MGPSVGGLAAERPAWPGVLSAPVVPRPGLPAGGRALGRFLAAAGAPPSRLLPKLPGLIGGRGALWALACFAPAGSLRLPLIATAGPPSLRVAPCGAGPSYHLEARLPTRAQELRWLLWGDRSNGLRFTYAL